MAAWHIRAEEARDIPAIHALVESVFEPVEYSSGNEPRIVDALRASGALTISLVAEEAGQIVGHVALSPVRIDGQVGPWLGLGPVAVRPDRQRQGIGAEILNAGLARARALNAASCVVFGEPAYYGRFGFEHRPDLHYASPLPEYFQVLDFGPERPTGAVTYHEAFDTP